MRGPAAASRTAMSVALRPLEASPRPPPAAALGWTPGDLMYIRQHTYRTRSQEGRLTDASVKCIFF